MISITSRRFASERWLCGERGKAKALLPHIGGVAGVATEGEDEEEL